jgi:hypothetical protein
MSSLRLRRSQRRQRRAAVRILQRPKRGVRALQVSCRNADTGLASREVEISLVS